MLRLKKKPFDLVAYPIKIGRALLIYECAIDVSQRTRHSTTYKLEGPLERSWARVDDHKS